MDDSKHPNSEPRLASHLQASTPQVTEKGTPSAHHHSGSVLSRSSDSVNDNDAATPRTELDDEHGAAGRPEPMPTIMSVKTNATTDPDFEVDWDPDDKQNPRAWPVWYRGMVLGFMSFSTWTIVIFSTIYTPAIPQMQEYFNVQSEVIVTLGVTTYLIGIAVGSLIMAPLSEIYGRRWVYIISGIIFTILMIPNALATSMAELIVLRFISAVSGSAMIVNAVGTLSDISSEEYRALAFSIWSIGPLNGPIFGPLMGGFVVQALGWRWTNWLTMIFCGVMMVMLLAMEETYSPVLLRRRAAKRRAETGNPKWWSRYDSKKSVGQLAREYLFRPFVMATTEPIIIFWNLYVAIIYGILYLSFVAYPIVFTGERGWSIGISGLAFIGIGIGTTLVIVCEPLIRRFVNSQPKDPSTGKVPAEATVTVICVAAVLAPIGQIWFAWTCLPPVHWIWCILSGIPTGASNTLTFIYASNYLARSYGIFAASALASSAVFRSLMGAALPLAGPAMYTNLGANWASTVLAIIDLIIVPIPFIFWKFGPRIRKKSALIRKMGEDEARLEGKRQSRTSAAMAGVGGVGVMAGQKADEEEARRKEDLERGIETAQEAGAYGVEPVDEDLERMVEEERNVEKEEVTKLGKEVEVGKV